MKKVLSTLLTIAYLTFASYAQEPNKPIATYQVGGAKITVWENIGEDGVTWKNFQVDKIYKTTEGEWRTSNSFSQHDLLKLKEAIEMAIIQEGIEEK